MCRPALAIGVSRNDWPFRYGITAACRSGFLVACLWSKNVAKREQKSNRERIALSAGLISALHCYD